MYNVLFAVVCRHEPADCWQTQHPLLRQVTCGQNILTAGIPLAEVALLYRWWSTKVLYQWLVSFISLFPCLFLLSCPFPPLFWGAPATLKHHGTRTRWAWVHFQLTLAQLNSSQYYNRVGTCSLYLAVCFLFHKQTHKSTATEKPAQPRRE